MKSQKGSVLVLVLGSLAVLLAAGMAYFYYQNQQLIKKTPLTWEECIKISGSKQLMIYPGICVAPDGRQVTQTLSEDEKKNIQPPDETANWKTYRSQVANFEFKYPEAYAINENENAPGPASTGYKFNVSLYLNGKGTGFKIGGVTSDFSQGRGGMLTDTQGYVDKDGQFYCTFLNYVSPIQKGVNVTKLKNENGVEMLLIKGKDFQAKQLSEEMLQYSCSNPPPNYTLVLINLNDPKYKGLGIEMDNSSLYLTSKQFDQILSTFRFD